ncbi:integrase [Cucumis melo var. makuwa]|uniref:Integrase n=1 Tax=Cucumis melo var. makuwa TaxID=1194695 RepID=A0A5A7THQ0_CUCMM|nr:integrase [Cucumis melo var. makuwa]
MASIGNMLQPQLPRGYTEVENQSELTNQQLVELRENPTSAKAAWDILKSTYQGEDKAIHVEDVVVMEDEEVEEIMIIEAVQILYLEEEEAEAEEEETLVESKEVVMRGLKVSFEGDICAIKDPTGVLIAKLRGKLDDKSETFIMRLIFNEHESWNWSDGVDEAKSPFHVNIDENKVAQELEQAKIQVVESSSSSTPSSTSDDEILPRRRRSIQEIYNVTNRINDDHFANFALFASVDLVTFDETIQDEKWKIAMDQEIDAIRRNETWKLMELPTNKQALGVKWAYKITLLEKDPFLTVGFFFS